MKSLSYNCLKNTISAQETLFNIFPSVVIQFLLFFTTFLSSVFVLHFNKQPSSSFTPVNSFLTFILFYSISIFALFSVTIKSITAVFIHCSHFYISTNSFSTILSFCTAYTVLCRHIFTLHALPTTMASISTLHKLTNTMSSIFTLSTLPILCHHLYSTYHNVVHYSLFCIFPDLLRNPLVHLS